MQSLIAGLSCVAEVIFCGCDFHTTPERLTRTVRGYRKMPIRRQCPYEDSPWLKPKDLIYLQVVYEMQSKVSTD